MAIEAQRARYVTSTGGSAEQAAHVYPMPASLWTPAECTAWRDRQPAVGRPIDPDTATRAHGPVRPRRWTEEDAEALYEDMGGTLDASGHIS